MASASSMRRVRAMPFTIFVTAYDQHAVRAFDANALDYLLKPYSDERQEATMARVKGRIDERSAREFGQRILRMVSTAPPTNRRLDRLVVKSGGTARINRAVPPDFTTSRSRRRLVGGAVDTMRRMRCPNSRALRSSMRPLTRAMVASRRSSLKGFCR